MLGLAGSAVSGFPPTAHPWLGSTRIIKSERKHLARQFFSWFSTVKGNCVYVLKAFPFGVLFACLNMENSREDTKRSRGAESEMTTMWLLTSVTSVEQTNEKAARESERQHFARPSLKIKTPWRTRRISFELRITWRRLSGGGSSGCEWSMSSMCETHFSSQVSHSFAPTLRLLSHQTPTVSRKWERGEKSLIKRCIMWVMKRMDKCGVLKTKSVNHCAFFLFVVDYRAAAPLFFLSAHSWISSLRYRSSEHHHTRRRRRLSSSRRKAMKAYCHDSASRKKFLFSGFSREEFSSPKHILCVWAASSFLSI